MSKSSTGRHRQHGLGTLPPEVRRQILSCLELRSLKALIRASTTYHQQYLFDRRYILCKSLEETLGSLTVDAYAVQLSTTTVMNTTAGTKDFFQSYSEGLSLKYQPLLDKLTEEEAVSMVTLYFGSVMPMAEYFAHWALGNLAENHAKQGPGKNWEILLSKTELLRFTRATYRFQLLCQVLNPGGWRNSISMNAEILFDAIEPWEVEELFAFYQFAQSVYEKISIDIRWDVHEANPKFDSQGRPPTPDGAFDLDNNLDSYLEGTTLCGLSLLQTVLFKIKDHDHLVTTMQNNIKSSYIPLSSSIGLLGESHQYLRRLNFPSERDLREQRRDPFPFRGDGESDAPPLAWTLLWGGTYSNSYGFYTSDSMRRWGYVFWDAVTLNSTGGKEVLMAQWIEEWDGDSRDAL